MEKAKGNNEKGFYYDNHYTNKRFFYNKQAITEIEE